MNQQGAWGWQDTHVGIIIDFKTFCLSSSAHPVSVIYNILYSYLEISHLFQVLQGAQLIAVASADPTSGVVDGSPLQANDIQVQYVQLAPVSEASATAQVSNCL